MAAHCSLPTTVTQASRWVSPKSFMYRITPIGKHAGSAGRAVGRLELAWKGMLAVDAEPARPYLEAAGFAVGHEYHLAHALGERGGSMADVDENEHSPDSVPVEPGGRQYPGSGPPRPGRPAGGDAIDAPWIQAGIAGDGVARRISA